jgi:quercetin dioxygenase-like cupin family protein
VTNSHHAVDWDKGAPIPGTPFRQLITGNDSGGRLSAQSAVLSAKELVMPHTHTREDEFTFVFRGTVGARVGAVDHLLQAGTLLHKPRGEMHAIWNPTDEASDDAAARQGPTGRYAVGLRPILDPDGAIRRCPQRQPTREENNEAPPAPALDPAPLLQG